jgi:5-deoxy-glucuronate isomerase
VLTTKSLLQHYSPATGYQSVINVGEGTLEHINFAILCLAAGQTYRFEPINGHEAALTILTGTLDAQAGDQKWQALGGRTTVFDSPTDSLLIPTGSVVELHAQNECEIAIAQATNAETGKVQLFPAAQATLASRGIPGWQRDVRTYIAPSTGNSRFILGETINAVGQWSSYPPHKHDQDNLPTESQLEEVYLFKVDPPTGFAFQGLYSPDNPETANRAFIVRNNDVVAIPNGYHPIASAPGHRVYYYWVLAGKGNVLKFFTEQSMRWLEPGL